jgi:hypothetical protein
LNKVMAEKELKLLPPHPVTPLWAPSHRPPQLNHRKKEKASRLHAKAKANLKGVLVAHKRVKLKAGLAALERKKPKKESEEKSLVAQVRLPQIALKLLEKEKAAHHAVLERAQELAVPERPQQREIAKNNTEPFTAVRAHDCMRFAEFR